MAISFNDPNIDRIMDMDYERYTDRLFEEAYGDRGERCRNCNFFCPAYGDDPNYCNISGIEECEDFDDIVDEYIVYDLDEECCEDWEWNGDDGSEVEY